MGKAKCPKRLHFDLYVAGLRFDFAENLPDLDHPFLLAIAGNSDPVFDVMADTAKPDIKAKITVDGKGVKKRDIWPIKTPFVCRLNGERPDPECLR